jgi:hypothetical protein
MHRDAREKPSLSRTPQRKGFIEIRAVTENRDQYRVLPTNVKREREARVPREIFGGYHCATAANPSQSPFFKGRSALLTARQQWMPGISTNP